MRRQLVLVTAAVTTMVVIAFLIPLMSLIRTLAAERATTKARQIAQSLAPVLAAAPEDLEVAFTVAQAQLGEDALGVYLPDGTTVGAAPPDEAVSRARSGEAFTSPAGGGRTLYVPVLVPDGGTAVVRATVPEGSLTAGVRTSWLVLAGVGIALIAGATFLADRLGTAAVAPVRDVAEAARRLGQRDLGARAPEVGPPEIAHMARALNGLAGRIAHLLESERERVADLSHRLRTPLTALRLDVEALSGGQQAQLAADVDALQRAVDEVIHAARRPLGNASPADIMAVARERVAFWRPLAEDQGRRWELDVEGGGSDSPITVALDPDELAAAIDALLANVISHTPEGVGCTVTIRAHDGQVHLTVEDDGPGMPAGALVQRGVSSAGSTGLGLDIARRTAQSAGGELQIAQGERGARVTMVLVGER